jgi:hypothetical protein
MNDDFFSVTQRRASAVGGSPDLRQLARKGAKFRCLFLSKILIHTPIWQRHIFLLITHIGLTQRINSHFQ